MLSYAAADPSGDFMSANQALQAKPGHAQRSVSGLGNCRAAVKAPAGAGGSCRVWIPVASKLDQSARSQPSSRNSFQLRMAIGQARAVKQAARDVQLKDLRIRQSVHSIFLAVSGTGRQQSTARDDGEKLNRLAAERGRAASCVRHAPPRRRPSSSSATGEQLHGRHTEIASPFDVREPRPNLRQSPSTSLMLYSPGGRPSTHCAAFRAPCA